MGTILKKLLAGLLAFLLILPVRADARTPHCGLTAHTHDDSCYTQVRTLTCSKTEISLDPHYHTPACYELRVVLNCTIDHPHSLSCYCSMPVLTCTISEGSLQYHHHSESCYTTQSVLTCTLPEHHHTDACYADKTADIESKADWEATLEGVVLTGDPATDLLAVAETQIGYRESTSNYYTSTRNGYTRYGAWAGNPYCDWCAAFICFCLYYADIDYPRNLGCNAWTYMLNQDGLFSKTLTPLPGDLVFFSNDGGKTAGHVGIVKEIHEKTMVLIEGNSFDGSVDCVRYVTRSLTDYRIFGYGILARADADTTQESEIEEAPYDTDSPIINDAPDDTDFPVVDETLGDTDSLVIDEENVDEPSTPLWVSALLAQLGTTCSPGTGPYGTWSGLDFSERLMEHFANFSIQPRTQGSPQAGDIVWFDHDRMGLVLYAGDGFLVTLRVAGRTVVVSSYSGPILGYTTPSQPSILGGP